MRQIPISLKIIFLLAAGCMLNACNKYLDVTPKGFKLLTTVADYDQWLNSQSLTSFNATSMLNAMSDLTDNPSIPVPATSPTELAYIWTPQYAQDADLWGRHYDVISMYNSVLAGIDEATGGSERQKASVKAEALLGRAFEYFYLINEYGKPYDSATADKDPGVQLVISDDVGQDVPPRSTVKQAYDLIIGDLMTAIPNLPEDNSKNRFRGSKGAGYALLARVCFFARNYAKAREYATLALESSPAAMMVDYSKVTILAPLPLVSVRPDALYARMSITSFYPTLEFMQSMNIRDNRLRISYLPGSLIPNARGVTQYFFGSLTYATYENPAMTVQEMKLIIAEVAARNNELEEALKQLDDIRKNRISAAYYQPYQSTDPAFVLEKVWEERRIELQGLGLRWFDMRRLDAEGRMPAVNRYDAQGNVIATLPPRSARYTLQVPDMVLQYNPGMPQNP